MIARQVLPCLYATGDSLGSKSSTQTASQSLQLYLQGSLGDRLTDRVTDHTTWSVTIGRVHSGEAKFCYCLRLQQVFIGAVDSTDRINYSNEQLYSAVKRERFPMAYLTGNSLCYFIVNMLNVNYLL